MTQRTAKVGSVRPHRPRRCGLFVVVEGADASGKTTLARRLVTAYRREDVPVVAVREPGGTRTSERVRRILLDTESVIGARTELFLYLAARAQVVDDVIRPAVARGTLVIADRFSLSTVAYQAGGRALPLRAVRAADALARGGLTPDLTIVLAVSERQQVERRRRQGLRRDRIESESARFSRAVLRAYRRFGRGPRHLVIDSGLGPDRVFEMTKAAIDRRWRQ
ncbi:MAG TPA: dTMP kinase [Acidobacteriota bacterium]|nr:dTMP kinase [Acidobacteriota bacterium]